MNKTVKLIIKIIAIVLACIIVVAGAYITYFFLSYSRIGDCDLDVNNRTEKVLDKDKELKIISYNTGFGAYEPDFSFFMDGGEYSWAFSEERLQKNLNNIGDFLKKQNSDFIFLQEVDFDSTRTYHVDERQIYYDKLPDYSYVCAQNYDSPFIMYPISQPHGKNKSSILTFSKYRIDSAKRFELPIEDGFTKAFDLDRCYSKSYVKTSDNKYLVLYNFHLSAYTSDGKIVNEQLDILLDDIQSEYDKGNYIVAGGDFNKDIVGDSSKFYSDTDEEFTWAQNIDFEKFKNYNCSLIAPFNEKNPVPSCRNADKTLEDDTFFLNIDGFIISDNVVKTDSNVIDINFKYSDHNPVYLNFKLK